MNEVEQFIEEYINTDEDLYWICKRFATKDESTVLGAIVKLRLSLGQEDNLNEAILLAENLILPKETNQNLLVLFYCLWSNVAYRCNRETEARILIKRAEGWSKKNVLPEFRAYQVWINALILSNNNDQFNQLYDQGLKNISLKNIRKNNFRLISVSGLCHQGMAQDALKELIKEAISPRFKDAVVRFKLIDHLEAGRWQNALNSIAALNNLQQSFFEDSTLDRTFSQYSLLLDFCLNTCKVNFNNSYIPTGQLSESLSVKGLSQYPTWLLANKALLENNLKEALHWARLEARSIKKKTITGFFKYNLIRTELSAGNRQEAFRLLDELRVQQNTHAFDHFFYARINYLNKEFDQAKQQLLKLKPYLDNHKAWDRFYLEIILSGELSKKGTFQFGCMISDGNLDNNLIEHVIDSKADCSISVSNINSSLVGESAKMLQLKENIKKCARLNMAVLITGETGTGKEMIAEAIHQSSTRKEDSLLKINCGAVSEALLESELFGHQKGAFTGAIQSRKGLFEEAGKGTIFLDEIGEISPRLQMALLRVLEASEVRPVGSNSIKRIHCRILTATNADLQMMTTQNKFRQDLFYRLNRLPIHSPSLRERKDDIKLLIKYFLEGICHDHAVPHFSDSLNSFLMNYSWPGNIRELKNEIERMVLMNPNSKSFDIEDLDMRLRVNIDSEEVNSVHLLNRTHMTSVPSIELPTLPIKKKHPMRRMQDIKEMFLLHKSLTRTEIATSMNVSTFTTTRDLKQLIKEGFIQKVEPSAAPRTHYFMLIDTV